MKYFNSLFVLLLVVFISCSTSKLSDGLYADINTDKGKMVVELHYKETPVTVANFVSLAEGTNSKVSDSLLGRKFYNGLPFHRVVSNFMIQGGDIQRNGKGNPGYTFEDEFPKDSLGNLLFTHDAKGTVSMANSGPNTNGSQFFITHTQTSWLDGRHTVFGKVIEGLNIIDSIQQGDEIISIEIIRKGKSAKGFSPEQAIEDAKQAQLEKERLIIETRKKDSIYFALEMKEAEAKVLRSGLKILITEKGNGKRVKYGDKIKVHYTGYFVDGKVFDTSYKREEPIQFTLGVDRVIEGWTQGIALLNAGGKARLFIPYELAYGERGYGPIPEKAKLIFDVEIIEIVK